MRICIRARDCQAEPGAQPALLGPVASCEALEEVWYELGRDAGAAVLDGQPEMPVALLGADDHRRLAVAERVRDEVREDPVERGRVDRSLQVVGHLDADV